MMKNAKGFMLAATDDQTEISICSWKDSHIVTMAFNADGVELLKAIERYGKPSSLPNCVSEHNKVMLGINLADWKTQKY